jgi:pimeloyl-ACP methyl ester carboxylesterase
VLVEGLGGTLEGWRRNVPGLAAELFVVALDLRGNGRSDPPPERATVETFADDLVALLDELAIVRAHVFGFSFGGMVAVDAALRHPERVRTLILGGTHAGISHAVRSPARVAKDRPWEALHSAAFLADHAREVDEDRRVRASHLQPAEARRRQWEAVRAFDAYDRLLRMRAPTLVLQGTEDRVTDPANARMLAERIPNAELVLLEGAGHLFHVERPERTDELVLDFAGRHRDG